MQAYLLALPAVNQVGNRNAILSLGPVNATVPIWEEMVDARTVELTANGVVEPMSNGIGGDLFVIYWDAKTQKLYGLNASGRSPYKLNRQVLKEKGLSQIPTDGPLSWSVPGCVSGWETLRARFGTRH